MDEGEIRNAIIEVVREIQKQSGRAATQVSDGTRPIGDLEGFDSLNAEEAAAMLSEQLGWEIEENVFVSRSDACPLRVREIAKRLCKGAKAKGGSHE